ncbi:helix-turn-helix transcriptional regulator [Lactococcus lactis]|nr:helix-turn-helix transcriptional regulator [Lactococcus lactis]MBU5244003.1 helix-turn-helix transcriptional regulator [Lactococcus lactis]
MAEKANITVRTIQRIENGTDVSLEVLLQSFPNARKSSGKRKCTHSTTFSNPK